MLSAKLFSSAKLAPNSKSVSSVLFHARICACGSNWDENQIMLHFLRQFTERIQLMFLGKGSGLWAAIISTNDNPYDKFNKMHV